MVLLLDAANTIIHKPSFYTKFVKVLEKSGINVKTEDLRRLHKLISEYYHFPDRTSKEFYAEFNKELLYGLGIIATDALLDVIYDTCSYLEWEKFEDNKYLSELDCQKSVLSNFHGELTQILNKLFSDEFTSIIISEKEKFRKPDIRFYQMAIEKLGVEPSEIIYVGDSVRLDLEPALKVGMNAWLIDRYGDYPYCSRRLQSLKEIKNLL